MEWLANISVKWVLMAVGILVLIRFGTQGKRARAFLGTTVEFAEAGLVATVVVFLLIRPFLFQAYYIPSESMDPTLTNSDRILVNKLIYGFRAPHRQEIAVFRPPEGRVPEQKDYIKRVIGLPGDIVEVVPERLLVDGKTLMRITRESASWIREHNFDPEADVGFTYAMGGGSATMDPSGNVEITSAQDLDLKICPYRPSDRILNDGRYVSRNGETLLAAAIGQVRAVSHDLNQWGGDSGLVGTIYSTGENPRLILVKGAKLTLDPGHVLINGKRLDEPYEAEPPFYALPPMQVPPHQYFMMGDNRNYSFDSHAWGPLPEERFIGRADLLFWPLPRLRYLTGR